MARGEASRRQLADGTRAVENVRERIVPLPHVYPFKLIDRLLARVPGSWAATLKTLGRDEAWVDAGGTWPVVLLAELMAQTAGLAAVEGEAEAVLVSIDRFRYRRGLAPVAGDRLFVSVRVVRCFGSMVKARGLVRVGGRRCAAAELALRVGSPDPAGE